jgi:hypothetical protein
VRPPRHGAFVAGAPPARWWRSPCAGAPSPAAPAAALPAARPHLQAADDARIAVGHLGAEQVDLLDARLLHRELEVNVLTEALLLVEERRAAVGGELGALRGEAADDGSRALRKRVSAGRGRLLAVAGCWRPSRLVQGIRHATALGARAGGTHCAQRVAPGTLAIPGARSPCCAACAQPRPGQQQGRAPCRCAEGTPCQGSPAAPPRTASCGRRSRRPPGARRSGCPAPRAACSAAPARGTHRS